MQERIFPFSDTDERRWKERLAFVDIFWKTTSLKGERIAGYILRNGGGLASRGDGKTIGDAIRNASLGQNIDWYSLDRAMTEQAWKSMAHL